MAASIAHFIALEQAWVSAFRGRLFAHLRRWPGIAVMRVKGVIYIAAEFVFTVEPRTHADEDAASEPLRTIVAVGNAAIGRVVIVAVRAIRSDRDFGSDLGLSFGRRRRKHQSSNSSYRKNFKSIHQFSSLVAGP